jgi:hypothetical protein
LKIPRKFAVNPEPIVQKYPDKREKNAEFQKNEKILKEDLIILQVRPQPVSLVKSFEAVPLFIFSTVTFIPAHSDSGFLLRSYCLQPI